VAQLAARVTPLVEIFRQIFSDWQKLCYIGFRRKEAHVRASRKARPMRSRRAQARAANLRASGVERLGRPDAAREALRSRRMKAARQGFAGAERNEIGLKPLITKKTTKWLIQRPQ
jgi:hypothetical protein